MKSLTVIFSSHKGKEYDNIFKEKIKKTSGIDDIQIICVENYNQYSLSEAYNIGYSRYFETDRDDDIIVYCHNDIEFKTKNWGKILINKFMSNPEFGVIGLAGSTELTENGIWWNNKATCYGIVDHTDGFKEWTTRFSYEIKNIKEVAVIDGVFIAVNPDISNWEFNENFKGFHMYDISFSLDNFIDKIKIGVITDIRILHQSVGMVNQEWENNRLKLIQNYAEYLPIKVV